MINSIRSEAVPANFIGPLALLFLVEFVRGAFLISYLPSYAVNILHFSVTTVGLAVTFHYLADTAVKCIFGYLLDRYPLRKIVRLGLSLSFIGLFSFLFIHHSWALIVSSTIFGIGISPVWLVCLSRVKEENRGAQMGLLYSFWLAGMGLGPVILNFFMDSSYAASYWFLVILWLVGWAASLTISNESTVQIDTIPLHRQWTMLKDKVKAIRLLLPGMVLQTMGASMLVPILPLFATKHLGLTNSQYSYVLLIGGACAVIGLIPLGKLLDKSGMKWFLVAGFGIFAISLYELTLTYSLKMAILWSIVLGISYSAVLPAWNTLLSYYVPENHEGLGWGIFSSVEGIGVIIGPILGGWFTDQFSDTVTVWISAGLFALISIFYLVFPSQILFKDSRTKEAEDRIYPI
ncbi:MFS transporter [Aneurinibacillus sp. Ricciae_BoGa-3]|uniref:MFS transporter n=1 Tax=Aneurinibacillus sp. Ricciae_BoGa-3 TaxID=3022697 RepID=UPI002342207A|nr:MFS transporter [Aneurinibacillus sp. Ricciae_BoGa-3]WCK56518.1 MFS transporter [Aneurinibacillus sp. Ricciae_BoGa-3]